MDSKIILFVISLFLTIYAASIISKKDNAEINIDTVLSPIIEEPIEKPKEEPIPVQTDVGNVLNKRTRVDNIYNSGRKHMLIQETDAEGGFNYSNLQGLVKKSAVWGRSGPDENSYEKVLDIQPKYLYGLNRNKNIKYFDKHFSVDGHQPVNDVSSAKVQERYRYMNTALSQLNNAKANSYKNNIDLDTPAGKNILTFSKSKILAPNFSTGYLDSREPINITGGIPVNKDLPPDVNKGVQELSNEIKFNNDNKIIYKII